jgi:hypothetical protein
LAVRDSETHENIVTAARAYFEFVSGSDDQTPPTYFQNSGAERTPSCIGS